MQASIEPLPTLELLYAAFDIAGDIAGGIAGDVAGDTAGPGSADARASILTETAAAMRCNLHLHQEGTATFWERSSVGHALTLGLTSTRGLRRVAFGPARPPAAAAALPAAPGLVAGLLAGLRSPAPEIQPAAGAAAAASGSLVGLKKSSATGGATVVGAAGEYVSAEHAKPLSFVLTDHQKTDMLCAACSP